MPMTSSMAWKARPRWSPKSASASTMGPGALARIAPMEAAQDSRAPVL